MKLFNDLTAPLRWLGILIIIAILGGDGEKPAPKRADCQKAPGLKAHRLCDRSHTTHP